MRQGTYWKILKVCNSKITEGLALGISRNFELPHRLIHWGKASLSFDLDRWSCDDERDIWAVLGTIIWEVPVWFLLGPVPEWESPSFCCMNHICLVLYCKSSRDQVEHDLIEPLLV